MKNKIPTITLLSIILLAQASAQNPPPPPLAKWDIPAPIIGDCSSPAEKNWHSYPGQVFGVASPRVNTQGLPALHLTTTTSQWSGSSTYTFVPNHFDGTGAAVGHWITYWGQGSLLTAHTFGCYVNNNPNPIGLTWLWSPGAFTQYQFYIPPQTNSTVVLAWSILNPNQGSLIEIWLDAIQWDPDYPITPPKPASGDLTATYYQGFVTVKWTTSKYPGLRLRSNGDPLGPSSAWSLCPGVPQVSGQYSLMTFPNNGRRQFYRLQ